MRPGVVSYWNSFRIDSMIIQSPLKTRAVKIARPFRGVGSNVRRYHRPQTTPCLSSLVPNRRQFPGLNAGKHEKERRGQIIPEGEPQKIGEIQIIPKPRGGD